MNGEMELIESVLLLLAALVLAVCVLGIAEVLSVALERLGVFRLLNRLFPNSWLFFKD